MSPEGAAAQVVELMGLNQWMAQDLVSDVVFGGVAPSILLALPDWVDAASASWRELPGDAGSGQLLMERIGGLAQSLGDFVHREPWPETIQRDLTLVRMGGRFLEAADVLRDAGGPIPSDQTSRIRSLLAATLYLTLHAARVSALRYVAEAEAARTPRPPGTIGRPTSSRRTPSVELVSEAAARLLGMEQIAGSVVGNRGPQPGSLEDQTLDRRLVATLAGWEVQSRRSLIRQPTTANLFVVARTEAAVAQLAEAVFWSRAVTGHLFTDDVQTRVIDPLAGAVTGWRDLAAGWRAMAAGDDRFEFDPDFGRASQRVATLVDGLIGRRPAAVDPAYTLAFAIDVNRACPALQDWLAHSADLAFLTRDLTAAPGSPLRGPAPYLEMRASELAGPEAPWVNLRSLNRRQLVPLPRPVRDNIAAAADLVALKTTSALAASGVFDAMDHGRSRPAPDTHGSERQRRNPSTILTPNSSPAQGYRR